MSRQCDPPEVYKSGLAFHERLSYWVNWKSSSLGGPAGPETEGSSVSIPMMPSLDYLFVKKSAKKTGQPKYSWEKLRRCVFRRFSPSWVRICSQNGQILSKTRDIKLVDLACPRLYLIFWRYKYALRTQTRCTLGVLQQTAPPWRNQEYEGDYINWLFSKTRSINLPHKATSLHLR